MNEKELIFYICDTLELLFKKSFCWISDNSVAIGFVMSLIFISLFFTAFACVTLISLFMIGVLSKVDKHELIVYISNKIEVLIRTSFSWISDNSIVIGFIIRIFHLVITFTMISLIVISMFIKGFRFVTFIILFVIWIQHILLECCVLSICELKLLNDELFLTKMNLIFGLPFSTSSIIFLIVETIFLFNLGFSLAFH